MKHPLRGHEAFPCGKHEARLRRMKGTGEFTLFRLDAAGHRAYNRAYQNILR